MKTIPVVIDEVRFVPVYKIDEMVMRLFCVNSEYRRISPVYVGQQETMKFFRIMSRQPRIEHHGELIDKCFNLDVISREEYATEHGGMLGVQDKYNWIPVKAVTIRGDLLPVRFKLFEQRPTESA